MRTTTPTAESGQRSTNWGRVAYLALALLTVALAWALVLASILLSRSGGTVDELTAVLVDGQQQREQALTRANRAADAQLAAVRRQLAASQQTRLDAADAYAGRLERALERERAGLERVRALSDTAQRRLAAAGQRFASAGLRSVAAVDDLADALRETDRARLDPALPAALRRQFDQLEARLAEIARLLRAHHERERRSARAKPHG
ncbi:hypothetical protein [Conexibacter sp. CPCC 206217]|uniref:hypothetical protein n=1 Tax=Conexibacter sp. CPCC 206217 TaxID=3064574 RepID=UPI0027164D6F|nr:hypothetical protein [Conexibacter sp. CPCC 206217]MDO8208863.1 hypothetical protein [Conexibacter sp. CPCC 206217]